MTTPNPLTPTTIQRLAFIRFLHKQGMHQSAQPEPVSGTAILSFQDAAEHFLLLSAEHLEINIPGDIKFLQYWERLQPALPGNQPLPGKHPLGRMNKLRVDLKHHGTIPSASAIAQAKADITAFFTDATPLVFGVDFATVDMADLVTRSKTVEILKAAQDRVDQGNIPAAMAGLRIAFNELISYYGERRERGNARAPFSFGPTLKTYRDRGYSLRNESRPGPGGRHQGHPGVVECDADSGPRNRLRTVCTVQHPSSACQRLRKRFHAVFRGQEPQAPD
ncbi:hypothetical protein FM076_30150 [Streptomyces albus subsp. chlorinus]|uniref:hypothetical protein n=1 Tax=Streptomyces albus TaxID=1888 RepID=UPI0015701D3D|nr:hypothetical protein [Streptomyces albus]NSC25190.1 hypothetical protein [Streptomyces albus subsp. chlorinus]